MEFRFKLASGQQFVVNEVGTNFEFRFRSWPDEELQLLGTMTDGFFICGSDVQEFVEGQKQGWWAKTPETHPDMYQEVRLIPENAIWRAVGAAELRVPSISKEDWEDVKSSRQAVNEMLSLMFSTWLMQLAADINSV